MKLLRAETALVKIFVEYGQGVNHHCIHTERIVLQSFLKSSQVQ